MAEKAKRKDSGKEKTAGKSASDRIEVRESGVHGKGVTQLRRSPRANA